ncbi:MAG: polyprenyl diphosphate synthase [Terriglobales bacterium]
MQSDYPMHVAVIMDGNGRWAKARGWARTRGHAAGVAALRRCVEAGPRLGIGTLTIYALSSDNWQRPHAEVVGLLDLLQSYLESERGSLVRSGVRCSAIGRRDRLPQELAAALAETEAATRGGTQLWLRLAVDYSGRHEMAAAAAAAAARWTQGLAPSPDLMRRLMESTLERDAGPVDLLIRTGGEHRLSDFLLWEAAYAELEFLRVPWPDFTPAHLRRALLAFARRERRFGGPAPLAAAGAARSYSVAALAAAGGSNASLRVHK